MNATARSFVRTLAQTDVCESESLFGCNCIANGAAAPMRLVLLYSATVLKSQKQNKKKTRTEKKPTEMRLNLNVMYTHTAHA